MSSNIDLNDLRDRVLSSQQTETDFPNQPSRSVYVDEQGSIVLDPNTAQGRTLSKVPLKTFAS